MLQPITTRLMQLYRTFQRWQSDDGSLIAASMSYYAVLSFFPLLLLLISVLGFVLHYSIGAQDAQSELLKMVADNASPALAKHLETALAGIQANALIGGPIGLIALLVAAVGVFLQIDIAMNRIWGRKKDSNGLVRVVLKTLFHRFRAFLMLLVVGLLVWASFAVSTIAAAVKPFTTDFFGFDQLWTWAHPVISVGVNAALLTLLYKTLSKANIRWTSASLGGLLAAVLWEVSRQILNWIVLGKKYTAYGAVGSLMALMLWIYIASSIFFFAAEYVRVMEEGEDSP